MSEVWTAGLLIGFLLGFGAAVLILYLPMRAERRSSADHHAAIAQLHRRRPVVGRHRAPLGRQPVPWSVGRATERGVLRPMSV